MSRNQNHAAAGTRTPTPLPEGHETPGEVAREVASVIARIRAGEVERYGEIVRRYRQEVLRVVVMMLADPARTENLVQQAFVNAYEHLDAFRAGEDFGRWVKTIARNLVRDELRRTSRERGNMAIYRSYLQTKLAAADRGEAREQSLDRALAECRQKLPAAASAAIELRYDQERSFEQIAETLGRRADAVRQIVARARVALKVCIEKALQES